MKKIFFLTILIALVASLSFVFAGDVITTGRTAPFPYACGSQWNSIDAALLTRNIKTVAMTVGIPGDTTFDANFVSATDTNEQTLDLGSIVPVYARVLDVSIICREDVNSSATPDANCSFSVDSGTAAGGAQWIATAVDVNDANDCVGSASGVGSIGTISASTQKVYFNATPGQNWSTIDAGEWVIIVTYLDLKAIKESEE